MPRTRQRATKLWWLGPIVVYICMLSAMLLVGTVNSALGMGATEGRLQILIDENVELEGSASGGWDWTLVRLENLDYTGEHLITIRWVIVDPTMGDLYLDNLSFNENEVESFDQDPQSAGWSYFENDPENAVEFQVKSGSGVFGTDALEIKARRTTSPFTYAQFSKSFDLTGVDNLTVWSRGSWDMREISDVISHTVTYSIALLVAYLHVTRFERRRFWSSVGVRRQNAGWSVVWTFALSLVFTAILYFYWQAVQAVMGSDPQQQVQGFFAGSEEWYFVYLAFAFFFPVAFTEELVFRGFTIERFLVKGAIPAITLSSLLFTSLHLWYASFGLSALPLYGGLFIVAWWWGLAYYKTRNIFGVVLFHGLFNLGMVVEHFWSTPARAMLESSIFLFGVACLGYLIYIYLRGLFAEIEELVKPWEEKK